MAGLRDIQVRQQQYQAKVSSGGGTDQLWLKNGDLAFVHFLSTGDDNDPYIEVYLAHEIPATEQGGYPMRRYCPVESGHDPGYDCEYCKGSETYKLKERMIMWFWVYDILHVQLRNPEEQLPIVEYQGRNYYRREVNRPLMWEDSAWRESPLDEIIFMGAQFGNLRNKQMILSRKGDGFQTRYKFYPNYESEPFNASLLTENPQPVIEYLHSTIQEVPATTRPEPGAVETYGQSAPAPAPSSDPAPAEPIVSQHPLFKQVSGKGKNEDSAKNMF